MYETRTPLPIGGGRVGRPRSAFGGALLQGNSDSGANADRSPVSGLLAGSLPGDCAVLGPRPSSTLSGIGRMFYFQLNKAHTTSPMAAVTTTSAQFRASS